MIYEAEKIEMKNDPMQLLWKRKCAFNRHVYIGFAVNGQEEITISKH